MEGYANYEPTSWTDRQPPLVLFNGITIERKKILDYFNEYYLSAVKIYNDYKEYGLPWNVGYMEIPEYLKNIYDLFTNTINRFNADKAEKARKKARKK